MKRWLLTGLFMAVVGTAGLAGSAQAEGGRHHRGHGHRDHGHHDRWDGHDRHGWSHDRGHHDWHPGSTWHNYGYYPRRFYYQPPYRQGFYIHGSDFSFGIRF